MRKKLAAGNWKMYKTLQEARDFCEKFDVPAGAAEVAFFAQAPLLPALLETWSERERQHSEWRGRVGFGVQNAHWEDQGAFTGDLSLPLAMELGATYVLAGHSERRQFFGETNETAVKRTLAGLRKGLRAVFCIGERLEERDAGHTFKVLQAQCAPLFAVAKSGDGLGFVKNKADLVIAYEPVWAIGTGRTATVAQAAEVHSFLREEITKEMGKDWGAALRILYGGSVKPENSGELMAEKNIDGVLVGGASLDPAGFAKIVQSAG